MDNGDGERKPLTNAEWKGKCLLIEVRTRPNWLTSSSMRRAAICRGEMKQLRVEIKVLSHRELGIERERLRHIADAIARAHVASIDRPSEQQSLASAYRQQAGQHLHCGGFAAAVRAHETRRSLPVRW